MSLHEKRQAGVCLHFSSLPGRFGIGEIGEAARAFIDSMQRMQLGVWQYLPTGPTGFGDSPYQSFSTFAGNELLIDIGGLVRAGLLASSEADSLLHLPASQVDYGALIPRKSALLDRAAGRFLATANSALRADYDAFVENNDGLWLHDYALFRVLKTRHGEQAWTDWAPQYARRDENALQLIGQSAAKEIERIKIAQFLFFEQWGQLHTYASEQGIVLFGDMPIYVALDSADAWARTDLLCFGADGKPDFVSGVPPDYFSADGQLWGNPVYNWSVHAADDYQWWTQRLRSATQQSDIVRIDHFRGFESYWCIPADSGTARIGEWLPGPGGALFDALQKSLGTLPIVAEDLGAITPEVESLRDRYGLPGMKVLQFLVASGSFQVEQIVENSVCYTGTHDNDTTLGWFQGSPGDMRSADDIARTRQLALEVTGGSPESIHNDMIRLAFSSQARLAIAPMQDYLGMGSEARLNTPGTPENNWRWRMRHKQLSRAAENAIALMVDAAGRGDA